MDSTENHNGIEGSYEDTTVSEGRVGQLLLKCFDDYLKRSGNVEITLSALCTQMLDEHKVSPDATSIELDVLENVGKVIKSEVAGETTYRLSAPKIKKSRPDAAPPLDESMKEISQVIAKCVKRINQNNNNQGASYDEILEWMKSNGAPEELINPTLQQYLDREVLYVKLKRNEAGLYLLAKKRGRPFGTGYLKKGPKTPNSASKRSPEIKHEVDDTGKRKRIRKSQGDFEFYDSASGSAAVIGHPVCDFCLKTSASNKLGVYEELLVCKDCSAKAHPSCMQYSELLATRAKLAPWQCIDCKTCSMCLDSGNPDDLLFCDACDKGYHMSCHDPPVTTKPTNKWACKACLDDGVNLDDLINPNSDGERSNSGNDSVFVGSINNNSKLSRVSGPMNSGLNNHNPSSSNLSINNQRSISPATTYRNTLPASITRWTVAEVSLYIRECGFLNEANKFQEQEIDGKSLLLLLREDVIQNMSLKLGPALKIYERIKNLQNGNVKLQNRV